MIPIRNLEIHVAHSCNLFCSQCTHYSNFSHKGVLTVEQANYEMGLWSYRINPAMFSLLGGEPAINRELGKIVRIARSHWKNKIQLVSNGFLLKNHPDLPKILRDTDCNLEISVHHNSEQYQEKFKPVEEMLLTWHEQYGINLNIRKSVDRWTRTYLDGPKPYNDNQPRKSWEICRAKWCPQIHEGKIWKCPQTAYLKMFLDKLKIDSPEWNKYLKYRPIEPDCTYEELDEFLNREDESCCKMCPANYEFFNLDNPLEKK